MKKVTVYSGESVEDKCGPQVHPANEVKNALKVVTSDEDEVVYSNHPDFVMAVKYIGIREKVETEFFLDGVSHGDDIEPIFKDFNRSIDLINELCPDNRD